MSDAAALQRARVAAVDGRVPLQLQNWVHPRPYIARRGAGGVTHEELAELSHAAPVLEVPIAELVGTQPTVSLAGVEKYIQDPDAKESGFVGKTGALLDLPLVVQFFGVDYVHDGHHRVTALQLCGEKKAYVRLIDLDARRRSAWAESRSRDDASKS